MEGAAVAQICEEFKIPYCIIRAISDKADSEDHINFPVFIDEIAKKILYRHFERIFKINGSLSSRYFFPS